MRSQSFGVTLTGGAQLVLPPNPNRTALILSLDAFATHTLVSFGLADAQSLRGIWLYMGTAPVYLDRDNVGINITAALYGSPGATPSGIAGIECMD